MVLEKRCHVNVGPGAYSLDLAFVTDILIIIELKPGLGGFGGWRVLFSRVRAARGDS